MKKRILSMMLCCFMLFGMIFIASADSTTPDHTRAGYDVVWFESFEDLEPGGKNLPSGWRKSVETQANINAANTTTTSAHHGRNYLRVHNQSATVELEDGGVETKLVTNTLFLPDTKLEANEKYLFSFETRHFLSDGITSARDSIKIWLSKPGVWGSDLIHTQEIVSGSWVNVEVDLSAYAGQTVTLSLEYTQRPGTPPLIFDCFYLFKKAKSPLALDFVMGNYGYKKVIVQTPVNKKIGFAGANWSNVYGDGYYFCTDATDLNSVFASRIPADSTDVFETDRQYYLCCQFELLDDFETSNFTKSGVNLVDYGTADELFMRNPNDTEYTYYAIFKLPIFHNITVISEGPGTASANREAQFAGDRINLFPLPNEAAILSAMRSSRAMLQLNATRLLCPIRP